MSSSTGKNASSCAPPKAEVSFISALKQKVQGLRFRIGAGLREDRVSRRSWTLNPKP